MSILGQNPADIVNALRKSSNLNDVADKAAARTNLNVPSKDEVAYAGVPIGTILAFWGSVAPSGYLPCSGQTITSGSFPALVTFLGGTTSAVVPDLRGEFLRGWDNSRGIDASRANLTAQPDQFQGHYHTPLSPNTGFGSTGGGGSWSFPAGSSVSTAFTTAGPTTDGVNGTVRVGSETRPRNVSVLYCIKAYESVQNFTSSLNISGLVSDYSNLLISTVKYTDFTGTNSSINPQGFQKLPSGFIIQWGTGTYAAGVRAITYPTVFPNAIFSINVTLQSGAVANYSNDAVGAITTSGFTAYQNSGVSSFFGWMAIGF